MKINVMSDIHNEFSVLDPPQTDSDVVVLAGDIDVRLRAIPWAMKFRKPVIYVAGNHEFYGMRVEEVKKSIRELTQNTNIFFLDDNEVIIDNVRFLGGTLWTDFKIFGEANSEFTMLDAQAAVNDYKVIKMGSEQRNFHPKDAQAFHQKTRAFLAKKLQQPFNGKTVVVTHHAPSIKSVHERHMSHPITPAYVSNLEYLMDENLLLWIHGHVHHCNDYVINGTRVVSNPRGYQQPTEKYSENRHFNPELLIEI